MHTNVSRRRLLCGAALLPLAAPALAGALREALAADGSHELTPGAVVLDHPQGGVVALEPFANRLSRQGGQHTWTYTRASAAPGDLNRPYGLAVTATGDILVANSGNDELLRFAPDGTLAQRIGGLRGARDVALDARGRVYVAEQRGHRVTVLDAQGTVVVEVLQGDLNGPTGLAIAADGSVVVAEPVGRRLVVFAPDGAQRSLAVFGEPRAVAFDPAGRLLVAFPDSVHRLDAAGGLRHLFDAPARIQGLSLGSQGRLRVQVTG